MMFLERFVEKSFSTISKLNLLNKKIPHRESVSTIINYNSTQYIQFDDSNNWSTPASTYLIQNFMWSLTIENFPVHFFLIAWVRWIPSAVLFKIATPYLLPWIELLMIKFGNEVGVFIFKVGASNKTNVIIFLSWIIGYGAKILMEVSIVTVPLSFSNEYVWNNLLLWSLLIRI